MRLREKQELSGEMGMSSMTDIIFILLIFFMMVSTMTHPSALNLSLPSSSKTPPAKATRVDKLDDIGITASGNFIFNNVTTPLEKIKGFLERNKVKNPEYKVSVSPDTKAPVEKVVQVLDMTQSMNITSVLQASAD